MDAPQTPKKLPCPACTRLVVVKSESWGKRGRCPTCRKALEISRNGKTILLFKPANMQTIDQTASPATHGQAQQKPDAEAAAASSERPTRRRVLIPLLVVLAICLPAAAILWQSGLFHDGADTDVVPPGPRELAENGLSNGGQVPAATATPQTIAPMPQKKGQNRSADNQAKRNKAVEEALSALRAIKENKSIASRDRTKMPKTQASTASASSKPSVSDVDWIATKLLLPCMSRREVDYPDERHSYVLTDTSFRHVFENESSGTQTYFRSTEVADLKYLNPKLVSIYKSKTKGGIDTWTSEGYVSRQSEYRLVLTSNGNYNPFYIVRTYRIPEGQQRWRYRETKTGRPQFIFEVDHMSESERKELVTRFKRLITAAGGRDYQGWSPPPSELEKAIDRFNAVAGAANREWEKRDGPCSFCKGDGLISGGGFYGLGAKNDSKKCTLCNGTGRRVELRRKE